MFRAALLVVAFVVHVVVPSQNRTKSIIDFYEKINTYGSLAKATSFISRTQSKLQDINTVRMVSYRVPHGRTSFGVRLRKTSKEHIALIELQCDQARVYVRSERSSHPRRFRLRRISTSTSRTHSYDLTSLLNNRRQRLVYLIFDQPMYKSSLSIVYYSESSRNLFSFSSMQHAKRRFRRTILPESPSSTCAKHEYEIDFNQFSFGQWIVQPKRFNAYVCSGSCPNPLSPQYFPSNHAILISLMSSQRPSGQQQPLCVPVQLKPLCLLYYDRDELVIKYHQDMIVQECGCR